MSRNLFLFFYFLLVVQLCFGQHRNSIWQMGYNQGGGTFEFDFRSGTLSIRPLSRYMNMDRTNSCISNEQGSLLFYTNGVYVANALHDTMLNGSGLNPSSFTNAWSAHGLPVPQGTLIIPHPNDTSEYYLFHLTSNPYHSYIADTLYYSKIDMRLDGGLGGVSYKNVILLLDALDPGELVATKHANGRDWWIVCHQHLTGNYIKYLVDPMGIHGPYFQSIGVNKYFPGQAVFSQDGSMYASYDNTNDVEIFSFDRCSGDFFNHRHIEILDSNVGAGISFSPNSRFIYISSNTFVYQIDLQSSNIADYDTIAKWDGFYSLSPPYATTFYFQTLAPDGKIYIGSTNSVHHIHVIEQPDLPGTSCNLQQHAILLPDYNITLPTFPNYYLGALIGSLCDSLVSVNSTREEALFRLDIFPNPVQDKLYMRGSESILQNRIFLYNSLLQSLSVPINLIKQGEYYELNTSQLERGVYFIEIYSLKGRFLKRFVKE